MAGILRARCCVVGDYRIDWKGDVYDVDSEVDATYIGVTTRRKKARAYGRHSNCIQILGVQPYISVAAYQRKGVIGYRYWAGSRGQRF